jgi:paired amphipathic helix protein Sin3a
LANSDKRIQMLYGNSTLFLFIRYYTLLYERLLHAKELAITESKRVNNVNGTANIVKEHETVFNKSPDKKHAQKHQPVKNAYKEFVKLVSQFMDGNVDVNKFEDEARYLLGFQAYNVFTIDRILNNMQKQLYNIFRDETCMKLIAAYNYEHKRVNAFTDNSYLNHVFKIINDEVCYRFEYVSRIILKRFTFVRNLIQESLS